MSKIRLDYHVFNSTNGTNIGIYETTESAYKAGLETENDDLIQIKLSDISGWSAWRGSHIEFCAFACNEANKLNPQTLNLALLFAYNSLCVIHAENAKSIDSNLNEIEFISYLMAKFNDKILALSTEGQLDQPKTLKATASPSIVINAPDLFADTQFVEWLNNGKPKMTWHQEGEPDEWSDVVVMVDPSLNGEGTDSDMPEHIWSQIVDACKETFPSKQVGNHIMVRLMNMEEDAMVQRPRG